MRCIHARTYMHTRPAHTPIPTEVPAHMYKHAAHKHMHTESTNTSLNNLNFPWQAPKSTSTTKEFPLGSMVLLKALGFCILILFFWR